MNLIEFLQEVLPLALGGTLRRIEQDLSDGTAKVYWIGDLIRIDFKPSPVSTQIPLTVPLSDGGKESVLIG